MRFTRLDPEQAFCQGFPFLNEDWPLEARLRHHCRSPAHFLLAVGYFSCCRMDCGVDFADRLEADLEVYTVGLRFCLIEMILDEDRNILGSSTMQKVYAGLAVHAYQVAEDHEGHFVLGEA